MSKYEEIVIKLIKKHNYFQNCKNMNEAGDILRGNIAVDIENLKESEE